MMPERRTSYRQRHVPRAVTLIQQQQRRCGTQCGRLFRGRPIHGAGRHPQLCVEAGQRSCQAAAQRVGQAVVWCDHRSVSRGNAIRRERVILAGHEVAAPVYRPGLGRTTSWGARFLRQRLDEIGRRIPSAPLKPHPDTWSDHDLTLAWLGHSTVLINFFGVRILTDPVLYRRIGVNLGVGTLGPLRLVECALTRRELPEIDLVLVSHAHFDHLDTPSLRSVRGMPAAVMSWGTSDLLPRRGYRSATELRWNETTNVTTRHGDVHVRSIEVKHWGARVARDTWRGYGGFIIEREGRRLLIAGD